jgi:hypothetical protein
VKRVVLLVGLIVVVTWLGTPSARTVIAAGLSGSRATLQSSETSPFYTCSDRTCVEQAGCGVSTCQTDQDCGACDPGERDQCLGSGWIWNDTRCACEAPPCDPAQEEACVTDWGTWDPSSCTCSNECNAGPEEVVGEWPTAPYLMGCYECFFGYICEGTTTAYRRYCEDYRVWLEYSIETEYCYVDFAPDCWAYCQV